jgi:hypothetical protein
MSNGYDTIAPNRIRHMEMIQAVVARLAGNSFLIKGWAVTIDAALLGFAASRNQAKLAWIAVAPMLLFWLLDAYYLYAERLFRCLYDQVRRGNPTIEPFYMAATSDKFLGELKSNGVSNVAFRDAFWRPAVCMFYLALLVATVLVGIVVRAS